MCYSEWIHLTNKTNKRYMDKFLTVCNIYINIEEIIKYLKKQIMQYNNY